MATLNTVHEGFLKQKTQDGYVKILPKTKSTLVTMNNGGTLQNEMPKTTTVIASASCNANTLTDITPDYSGVNGTILMTFLVGVISSYSSSQITNIIPTYGNNPAIIERVRVQSTGAQTIYASIGIIYK